MVKLMGLGFYWNMYNPYRHRFYEMQGFASENETRCTIIMYDLGKLATQHVYFYSETIDSLKIKNQ